MTVFLSTLLLIFSGAFVILAGFFRFRSIVKRSRDLFPLYSKKRSFLSGLFQVLMIVLMIGDLIVVCSLSMGYEVAGVLFMGAVLFVGAILVFLGVELLLDMLVSIKLQRDDLITINEQLQQTENVTIYALAYQAELRDQETGRHIERTSKYVQLLAEELSRLPKYEKYLRPEYIKDLVKSAPLHDIGKVGIPDSILTKPGKLTETEFEIIKKHCEFGTRVLLLADEKLSFQSFLKIATQMVRSHHEKWNGNGYPEGLKNDEIPLSGRIMALADVYDALRSERYYKKAFSHEKACEIILSEKGKQFDPDVVDAFLKIESEFDHIF